MTEDLLDSELFDGCLQPREIASEAAVDSGKRNDGSDIGRA